MWQKRSLCFGHSDPVARCTLQSFHGHRTIVEHLAHCISYSAYRQTAFVLELNGKIENCRLLSRDYFSSVFFFFASLSLAKRVFSRQQNVFFLLSFASCSATKSSAKTILYKENPFCLIDFCLDTREFVQFYRNRYGKNNNCFRVDKNNVRKRTSPKSLTFLFFFFFAEFCFFLFSSHPCSIVFAMERKEVLGNSKRYGNGLSAYSRDFLQSFVCWAWNSCIRFGNFPNTTTTIRIKFIALCARVRFTLLSFHTVTADCCEDV